MRAGFKAEAARIAAEMRGELALGTHDRIDPVLLAEHLAVPVLGLDELDGASDDAVRQLAATDPGDFSAVTVLRGTVRAIVVNHAHAPARRASSVAHELAHALLEHEPGVTVRDGGRSWSEDMEDEADWLAGELLLPREAALAAARAGVPLGYVAARFGVSVDLVRWRLDATGARRQASLERWRRRVERATARPPAERPVQPTLARTLAAVPSESWLALLDAWDAAGAEGLRGDALADRVVRVLLGPIAEKAESAKRDRAPSITGTPHVVEWANRRLAGSGFAVRSVSTVFGAWTGTTATTAKARSLAETLEAHAIGMEPDARLTTAATSSWKRVVLFRLPEPRPEAPRPRYHTARALLHVAAATARNADEQAGLDGLTSDLATALALSECERVRLAAFRRWLAERRRKVPTTVEVVLPGRAKVRLHVRFLRTITSAAALLNGGLPNAARTMHGLLFREPLDPKEAPRERDASGPVTLLPGASASGYAIPPPGGLDPVRLDPAVVRAKLDETAQVEALLAPIFATEDAHPAHPAPDATATPLDSAHAELLRSLVERDTWSREEIESLASRFGLMSAGALDTINDAAFDVCGEPVVEGGDEVRVEPALAARLL